MSRVRQQLFRSFRHRSRPVCNHYHLITCSVHPSSRPRWLVVPRPPPGCSCCGQPSPRKFENQSRPWPTQANYLAGWLRLLYMDVFVSLTQADLRRFKTETLIWRNHQPALLGATNKGCRLFASTIMRHIASPAVPQYFLIYPYKTVILGATMLFSCTSISQYLSLFITNISLISPQTKGEIQLFQYQGDYPNDYFSIIFSLTLL
jgi:hypothetical protein